MKVHYGEGVANRTGAESCAAYREVCGEALTPISRDRKRSRVPTQFRVRKAIRWGALCERLANPAWS